MKRLIIMVQLFIVAMVLAVPAGAIVLEDIEIESPGVWDIRISDEYVPQRGGIKVLERCEKFLSR